MTAEEHRNTVIAIGFLIKIPLPSIQFLDFIFLYSQLNPLPASKNVYCWQVLSIYVLVFSASNVVALDKCCCSEKVMKTNTDSLHLSTSLKNLSLQCRNSIKTAFMVSLLIGESSRIFKMQEHLVPGKEKFC